MSADLTNFYFYSLTSTLLTFDSTELYLIELHIQGWLNELLTTVASQYHQQNTKSTPPICRV